MDNQRVRLTKRLLKEALISLMQTTPFDRITVKKLCEEAGINRTTFYLHYTDTEKRLTEIEDDLIGFAISIVNDHIVGNPSSSEIFSLLNFVQANLLTFKTLLSFEGSDSFVQRSADEIVKSIKERFPETVPNEKKELLMHFALVGALALIHEWVNSDLRLMPEEMAEILDKMYHCIIQTT